MLLLHHLAASLTIGSHSKICGYSDEIKNVQASFNISVYSCIVSVVIFGELLKALNWNWLDLTEFELEWQKEELMELQLIILHRHTTEESHN